MVSLSLRTRGGALRPRRLARRLIGAALAFFSACLGLSGCQDSNAAGALAQVEKADRLIIATDALYPPNEFKQGDRIVGFDIDLGTAIARKLGVKAEFQDVKFDTILPALSAGKYDISLSSLTDTSERERRFDFVTYLSAGTMLLVRKGNPRRLRPDDLSLCGKKIAVEKGTTQEDELLRKSVAKPSAGARSDRCRNSGRRAPIRMSFDDQEAANDALARGRADAVLADAPSVLYGVRRAPARFEVSGQAYGTALYGIAVPKHHDDLRDAIFDALKDLISDGDYRTLVTKWGLAGGAVDEPKINAAA